MKYPIRTLAAAEFPKSLLEIPQPPPSLTYRGLLPLPDLKLIAVVGSRKCTPYGARAVAHLIRGLQGYPVGIVSGLALGIDALAHESALTHSLYTMAIPGSGLNDAVLYPASHKRLARRILESGGSLVSPFAPDFKATKWSFTARNRIMAGLTSATLLIEATAKSGTLITARLAADYNRDVLVVPGDIFAPTSFGVHQFLKLGATPITSPDDLLHALGITPAENTASPTLAVTPAEAKVLELLKAPRDRDELIRLLGLPTNEATTLLMMLEIKGYIVCNAHTYSAVVTSASH